MDLVWATLFHIHVEKCGPESLDPDSMALDAFHTTYAYQNRSHFIHSILHSSHQGKRHTKPENIPKPFSHFKEGEDHRTLNMQSIFMHVHASMFLHKTYKGIGQLPLVVVHRMGVFLVLTRTMIQ